MMRIPLAAEAQHFEIIGDTGTERRRSSCRFRQIQARHESAIIYDLPAEYVRRFYDSVCDIILNPLDERCPYWGRPRSFAGRPNQAIAASLYQPTSDKKGEFSPRHRKIIRSLADLWGRRPRSWSSGCLTQPRSTSGWQTPSLLRFFQGERNSSAEAYWPRSD